MIFEKNGENLSQEAFEKLTGVRLTNKLVFDPSVNVKLEEPSINEFWLGTFFEKELSEKYLPDVVVRYVDDLLGWGVFANRNLPRMHFIAEYTGFVRKRKKEDEKNAYCFEYPYKKLSIDAREQGSLARFVNHSDEPNLESALARSELSAHVILYTKRQVAKGEQLCYNYGPDYWSKRSKPVKL